MAISFGSDPEFMLVKDGKYYSAIDIIKGTSSQRIKKKGHEFYWDNVMAECAIKPGDSKQQVIDNITECLGIYANLVKPYQLRIQASQEYPAEQLACEAAQQIGCAPDMCPYDEGLKKPPKTAFKDNNLRTCGGHIHLGDKGEGTLVSDGPEPVITVYLLDLFLGIPSLFLDHDPTSARRRSLYGQAGRYREKDYGIEYRSLGNFWLGSPQLVGLVYDICNWVVESVSSGESENWWEFNEETFEETGSMLEAFECTIYNPAKLRKCINRGDKVQGKKFMEIVSQHMPSNLYDRIVDLSGADKPDFYKSWGI